jgi:Raf kinase inhibitor-like YbhB/YbcL family protein
MSLDRPRAEDPYAKLPAVASFAVTSSEIDDGQPLPTSTIGSGDNRSPDLAWSGAPEGTKSYVVTCYDPDAPTPSGFWHWIAVDVPGDVSSLDAGAGDSDASLPGNAFHLANDMGDRHYDGAAPPEGDAYHRYYYVVHAVDKETLGVGADASPAVVSFHLAFSTLGRAIITGTHEA